MFIALIAALQSSIDSGINSTSLMVTRDIRRVLFKNADPDRDLVIGRYLTLVLLLAAMVTAPLIAEMGGVYQAIQTVLSLIQGPLLALLVLGAFTKTVTAMAGIWTLVTGLALAAALLGSGMNMLYVAFSAFAYSLIALPVLSIFTTRHSDEHLANLVYTPWRKN